MTELAARPFEHFARIRRCPACRAVIAPETTTCEGCDRYLVAPHSDLWDPDVKRHQGPLLVARHTQQWLDEHGRLTHAGWCALLIGNYRGTFVGEGRSRRLIPFFGASVDDIYPFALPAAKRWAASLKR